MEIKFEKNGSELIIFLKGRLDTNSSPELGNQLPAQLEGVDSLIFDFKELDYLSSAGLRLLLASQKDINARKGKMVVRNINPVIKEIFSVSGFDKILTIE
jgi:anti-sigma B factor antagonist